MRRFFQNSLMNKKFKRTLYCHFDQFNASLLNWSINFLQKTKNLKWTQTFECVCVCVCVCVRVRVCVCVCARAHVLVYVSSTSFLSDFNSFSLASNTDKTVDGAGW